MHYLFAQTSIVSLQAYDSLAGKILTTALGQNQAINVLQELCAIGPRLSGSPQADRAVEWALEKMRALGFQNVHTEPVEIPHWVRGLKEEGFYYIDGSKKKNRIHITALGGSIRTSKEGLKAEIVEVQSWEELAALGDSVKGKIVFLNRPMDRSLISSGRAYGRAVDQRSKGAIEAANCGAIGVLVRSMTTRLDDMPHTGQMNYADSVARIPAASISTNDAEVLSRFIHEGKKISVSLKLSCDTLPAVESANVMGEIVGSEKPDEIVLIGAHLDSWDKGQGAHDDGAGCIHAIESLRLIKELGLRPKRTIRAVLFMNEENGLQGGLNYASRECRGERHIVAIESDAGGFSPRGFSISDSSAFAKLAKYASVFSSIGADNFRIGGSGSDIHPLVETGVPGVGLIVDGQKYFDYHHSDNDTIDKVHERELALGAAVIAIISFIIAQEGL
jgi:hypothetical protein